MYLNNTKRYYLVGKSRVGEVSDVGNKSGITQLGTLVTLFGTPLSIYKLDNT
jgi:hypothetical protein